MPSKHWWIAALCALLLAAVACGDGEVRSPAAAGSYGVGVTEMTFTRTSNTTGEPRVLDTVIWYPADRSGVQEPVTDAPPATDGSPFPVITFSHGNRDAPTVASYLMEHLASWGFVVVAPPHRGNTKADCPCTAEDFNDAMLNRVPDIIFVLDAVLGLNNDSAEPLGKIVDPERTVSLGYSLGGLTAFLAAEEDRFDVMIVLAAPVPPESADTVRVPIILMAGGKDDLVDVRQVPPLYTALPDDIPRYLILVPEAGHHAFRDFCDRDCDLPQERSHELVKRYVTAFLQVHLLEDERYRTYLEEGDPPDAELTFDRP
jgi:predicted dienelactone hydrolase